jgi:hypothetical protein
MQNRFEQEKFEFSAALIYLSARYNLINFDRYYSDSAKIEKFYLPIFRKKNGSTLVGKIRIRYDANYLSSDIDIK